jgi:RHS repeat-associated protein
MTISAICAPEQAQSRSRSTGKERDAESGNDYFEARYYSSAMGRFISPDKPFADQHPANPQSWNLYSYTRNNPLTSVDTDGEAVKALNDLALQRIQSTLPSDVQSQVTAGKDGMLDRASIDGIKSTDSNVVALKQLVDGDPIVEVNAASSVQGGSPSDIAGVPFEYESAAAQQAETKDAEATGFAYDGYTQSADQSPSGNIRVTVPDGTGSTSTEPTADLARATAHELYGHALPLSQGKPWKHDDGGPVDKNIKKIEDHTMDLNKK